MKNIAIYTLLLIIVYIIAIVTKVEGATPGPVSFSLSNCKLSKRHFDEESLSKDDQKLLKQVIKENKILRESISITEEQVNNINWEDFIPKSKRNVEGTNMYLDGCADVTLPLMWENATNPKTIKGYIKRYSRDVSSTLPKVQLWLLQGGPGGSGAALYRIADMLLAYFDKKDTLNPLIYVPDHRGTGFSSYLQCDRYYKSGNFTYNVQVGLGPLDDQRKCWEDIVRAYPNGELKGFGTTAAAKDILYYIAEEKKNVNTAKAFVYGVSYGTYWLNRILDLEGTHEANIDGAIADSVVKPSMDFLKRDLHYEEAAGIFMKVCENSKACLGRFDKKYKTTEEMMKAIYGEMDKNSCMPLSSKKVGFFISSILPNMDLRRMIFPIFYRYHRCNLDDRWFLAIINQYLERLFPDNLIESMAMNHDLLVSFALWEGAEEDIFLTLKKRQTNALEHTKAIKVEGKRAIQWGGSISTVQRQQNNNIFALIGLSEIADTTDVRSKSYWSNRYNSVPPYVNTRASPMLTGYYEILKNDLYTDARSSSYANYNKRMLNLHCDTDPQTPKSFATNWFNHYSSAENIMYPNCVHGAIISAVYKKDVAKERGLPSLGMENIIEFLTEKTITSSTHDLFDKEFQFEKAYNDLTIKVIFVGTLCFSFYEECIPYARPVVITLIVLSCLCCLCCFVCCLICCITCCVCIVRSRKKDKEGSFVRFEDDSSHAAQPPNTGYYPDPNSHIYSPPVAVEYPPNQNPYPL